MQVLYSHIYFKSTRVNMMQVIKMRKYETSVNFMQHPLLNYELISFLFAEYVIFIQSNKFFALKGVPEIMQNSKIMLRVGKKLYMIKNHQCKYIYDKIYTIGYYSRFYSSLRDKI